MNYLEKYLAIAPVALAIIRANECHQLSSVTLSPPILDLGCGDGIFAKVFFEKPIEIGFDISEEEIAAARQFRVYKHLVAGDAHCLPFSSNSIATVFSNSVLEHIPNLGPVLSEVHRVLRPGGLLVLTAPTPDFSNLLFFSSLFHGLGLRKAAVYYSREVNKVCRHYNLYDLAAWQESLHRAGLTVEEHRTFNPAPVMMVHDLFFPSSLIAFLCKKLLGRWIFWPGLRQRLMVPFLKRLLAKRVGVNGSPGGSLLIVARKGP